MSAQTLSTPPQNAARRAIGWSALWSKLGPLIALAFVFALFAILKPHRFLSANNLQIMLVQTTVVATAALGMTMIIISGGIDLSIGSNIALCTVVVAQLLAAGYPPLFAALGGIACGAACGLLIGLFITRLNVAPFIVTLGTLGALRGAAKGLAHETTVNAPATWLNGLLQITSSENRWMILPPGVWLVLALTVLVAATLRYTRFGRHIFAIGSNEQTARLCGVPIRSTKLLIYVIGLSFAGMAGVLQFSYLTVGDPTTAPGYELSIIAAVVIGGASLSGGEGSVFGSLVGALIMTVVANGCAKINLANWVQEIVTGGIIIMAVVLDRLRHRGMRT